jgi:transcriptional regulator with XRE-family HTH domain
MVARRVELGLSQRQVAKALTRLGLATAARSVGHWEVGTCSPCEARMEALSLVLAVELWQLEGWLWPGLAVPSARLQRAVALVDAGARAAGETAAAVAEAAREVGEGLAVALAVAEDGEVDELEVARARRELAEIRDRTGRLEAALDRAHQETVRRRQSSRAGNE